MSELSTEQRCLYVQAAADFLVTHQAPDGSFHPPDSRAGYNEAYDAKGMYTLLQAAYVADDRKVAWRRYVDALRRRLRRFVDVQRPDGAVPLVPGQEAVIGLTVGAVASAVRHYRELTDDPTFDPLAHRCLDYLIACFTTDRGFEPPTNRYQLNYQNDFPLYACSLWRDERVDAAEIVEPATRFLTEGRPWNGEGRFWRAGFGTSKGFALDDIPHPTLDLDRAWVLFEMYGLRFAGQIESTIRENAKLAEAAESYYDEDGERMEECRIRMPLAALMALFDRSTGTATFTSTPIYRSLLAWTVDMFDPAIGGFAERVRRSSGRKECYGVPGQYLAQYVFSRGLLDRTLQDPQRADAR
jgi:hypothetical protein